MENIYQSFKKSMDKEYGEWIPLSDKRMAEIKKDFDSEITGIKIFAVVALAFAGVFMGYAIYQL